MKQIPPRIRSRYQRGAAAVEAAIVISLVFVPLMAVMSFYTRYFWYYTAAQKAAHDAALYMARAPLADIQSGTAKTITLSIIRSEFKDLTGASLELEDPVCGYMAGVLQMQNCSATRLPDAVKISLYMVLTSPGITPSKTAVYATMPYVGH